MSDENVRMRIEAHAVLEYDVRLSDYNTDDPDVAVQSDREAAEEDLFLFLDSPETAWTVAVTRV